MTSVKFHFFVLSSLQNIIHIGNCTKSHGKVWQSFFKTPTKRVDFQINVGSKSIIVNIQYTATLDLADTLYTYILKTRRDSRHVVHVGVFVKNSVETCVSVLCIISHIISI